MSKELDELFGSYEKRKQAENEAAAAAIAKARAAQEIAVVAFKQKVVPALQGLIGPITAKGHKAEIIDKLGEPYPSVTFVFTPAQLTKGPPFQVPSRVAFSHYDGAIETRVEVALGSRATPVKIAVAELNPDWVTKQAMALIEAALEKA